MASRPDYGGFSGRFRLQGFQHSTTIHVKIMTCLIAWIGVDSRGPSPCYLAADSRFTWGNTGIAWDHGRKVFGSRKSPDIWGYYGDVLFPSTVIGQIVEAIAEGLLVLGEDSHSLFKRAFHEQLRAYPSAMAKPFGVLHCRRSESNIASTFAINHLSWQPNTGWSDTLLPIPVTSEVVDAFGSGKAAFNYWSARFSKSDIGSTSRAVFQAFCKTLEEGEDPLVGGAPQLASLIRIGNGRQQGVVWNGEAWLAGLRLARGDFRPSIEFMDAQFQRCDPASLALLQGAQPQPHPTQIHPLEP